MFYDGEGIKYDGTEEAKSIWIKLIKMCEREAQVEE